MGFINLLFFIFFITGAGYCFWQYILKGSGFQFFIGLNSLNGAFGIIKDSVPREAYFTYNVVRITFVLSILAIVYFIRKKRSGNISKEPYGE